MYSFCLTIPYGFLMAAGGAIGYLKAGSMPSLIAGAGSGGILALLGYGELNEYKSKGKVSTYWTALSLLVSGGLLAAMGMRCSKAGASFIPITILGLSASMSGFYIYRLIVPVKGKHAKE